MNEFILKQQNEIIKKEKVKIRKKTDHSSESAVLITEYFDKEGRREKTKSSGRILEFNYNSEGETIKEIETIKTLDKKNIFDYYNSSNDIICYKNGRHICTMYKDPNNNIICKHFYREDGSIDEELLVYSDIFIDNLIKRNYKDIVTENSYNIKGKIERSISYNKTLKNFISDNRFKYETNRITVYEDITGLTTEYLLDNKGLVVQEIIKLEDYKKIISRYNYQYEFYND